MAITVDVQDNPTIIHVGKEASDATIIYSGFATGNTSYNIERLDGSETEVYVADTDDITTMTKIVSVSVDKLEIFLAFRTWYRVRTSHSDGGAWTTSDWTAFKTRDKRYQTPDAITQFEINPVTGVTNTAEGATVVATNVSKSTVVETAAGATVTNTDIGSNQISSITYTDAGATIVSKDLTPY